MRELLRHAIERARTEDADFARTAGQTPAERLGGEVIRLARVAASVHLMASHARTTVDAEDIAERGDAISQGVVR